MATEHFNIQAIWSTTAIPTSYPILSADTAVDVAVVGGGITGISTAYHLAKAGQKVAVLESKQIGMGTTGSSTGNLYATTDEHLHKIASNHNEETMKAVVASRGAAIDFIEERIREHTIDCEFKRVPWFLFTTEANSPHKQEVEHELEAAKKAGLSAIGSVPSGFPYQVATMTQVENQAQFNPLRYVQRLAAAMVSENCQIYENTKVLKIEDGDPCLVHTDKGNIRAKQVVQATHSPKGIYAVHAAMEVYREYAFAVRLKGDLPAPGVYWHLHNKQLYSVRPYSNEQGNFLLVLDASHKLGHQEHTEEHFKKVEKYLRSHFDVDSIEYSWAAQNYKAADRIPYIGTSPMQNNVYIATGFAADGLVYGTLASMMISDTILGKENPWVKMYDPKRFTPVASAKRFISENVDVATHLVKDYLLKKDDENLSDIPMGEGKIVKINGNKVAAYRNEQGQLQVVSAVCPHMGCIVHWNHGEKSWDCPCHGSRFSTEGEVLEGPAFDNLKPHF